MQRREFITVLAAAAWPAIARAQQPTKVKRIAIVDPSMKVDDMTIGGAWWYRAFFQELSRLGYINRQNLVVERYSGEGRTEHYAELTRNIAGTHPDLIFAVGGPLALGLKTATTIIPIVTVTSDPIVMGLVPSVARPGGNITGVAIDAGLEIYGKRFGLLIEAVPKLSNVGYLASQRLWEGPIGATARKFATKAGISLTGELLGGSFNEQEYLRVFSSMERDDPADGLMVSDEIEHATFTTAIVGFAAKNRIPAIYPYRAFVDAGGLMVYTLDYVNVWRRIANLVDQILKGANPGDIPFYQETKFELVINLKTAKALGLDLPPTLLGRADEVIE